jgi:hypothetical protein
LNTQYQKKLSHLSQEQIERLMQRYYDGEKNDLLIKEYNIDIRTGLLVKTFPILTHDDILCPYCDIPMVSYRESKSSYAFGNPKAFCQVCKHKKYDPYCNCENCKKLREDQAEILRQKEAKLNDAKRQILIERYEYENSMPISIDELTIKDKLYICALLRTSLSEDFKNINPLSSVKSNLAPTQKYKMNIISYLRSKLIVLFSPSTSLHSIIIENNEIQSYYPLDVTLKLNAPEEQYDEVIQDLLHLNIDDDINNETKLELWNEIGLFECLEFLYAKMDEYNLPSEHVGDKTISAIKESLKDFSISQNFNFIWRAVTNAAAFYQKSSVSKKHAVNTISGSIIRSQEKAKAENWQIKGYGRDYNYPQTVISEVFFNNILQIGSKGFESKIS